MAEPVNDCFLSELFEFKDIDEQMTQPVVEDEQTLVILESTAKGAGDYPQNQ